MGGKTLVFSFGKLLLLMLTLLVIELVRSFEGTAWNQAGGEAWLVGGEGGQHARPPDQERQTDPDHLWRFSTSA